MHRLLLYTFAASALFAQNPADLFNKPPAGVDEALRARINEFYQLHVKQQFRQAEGLVAKDTQEFFYTKNKPQYLTFEIQRIEYSKDFTHAKATMITEQYVMMPGFANKPMKIPSPSTWKLEDGKWVWYVDQDALRESPFGKMTAGPGGPGPGLPPIPATPDFIMGKVKAEKGAVTLKPGESAEVKFSNAADGYMSLRLVETLTGIDASFDQWQIKPNGVAVLKLVAGKGARSGTIGVRVEQTVETIPISVTVIPGPEPEPSAASSTIPDATVRKVKADKDAVTIKPGGSAQVKLANGAAGSVTLKVVKPLAGIVASFDRSQVKPDGDAVLKLVAGKGAKSGTIGVRVEPGAEIISIAVTVK
jgi:hypothetical protein